VETKINADFKAKLLNGKGSRQQSEKNRLVVPVPLSLDLLNPKSTGFARLSRTITVPNFQVIPIMGFCFIMLTYTPTHLDKVIATSAQPYYVGMDNQYECFITVNICNINDR